MSDEEVSKLAKWNGSTPAFATPPVMADPAWYVQESGEPGMTLREWLAGMALQGLLARGAFTWENAASEAALYADALLVELAKKPSSGA